MTPSLTETETTTLTEHPEDCCSAISGTAYSEIDCASMAADGEYVESLEAQWKALECGRSGHLPTEWRWSKDTECGSLWAAMAQIYGLCALFDFTKNDMKLYEHFAARGAAECFGRDAAECLWPTASPNVTLDVECDRMFPLCFFVKNQSVPL